MAFDARTLTALSLAVALGLHSAQGLAQPSAAQKETARGLMAEGRELREQGDWRGALTRFQAADSLMLVPTTGYEVAATQAALGQLVEARDTLRRVLALPQASSDPEPFNEARVKARALDQQLASRIGALRFVIRGVAPDTDVELRVDGETVPKALWGLPFRVNPGRHVVSARSRGQATEREVETAESQSSVVELAFRARSEAPAPLAVPRATKSATPSRGPGTLVYVAGGMALAGVIVGSVAGISAVSHRNAAKRECVNGLCPPSTWHDLDSSRSMATVSTVAFAVGGAAAVVGIGALLLSPQVGPHEAALTVRGTF